jgi:N-acetylglucosamine-6-phosphate deacetylase
MTYRHKLARRLALIRDHAVLATAVLAAACSTDGGLTGSGFDPLDSNTQIVRLIASSDNPTIPAASRTPLRAVGLTADGRRSPVKDAVWVTLDGGDHVLQRQ